LARHGKREILRCAQDDIGRQVCNDVLFDAMNCSAYKAMGKGKRAIIHAFSEERNE